MSKRSMRAILHKARAGNSEEAQIPKPSKSSGRKTFPIGIKQLHNPDSPVVDLVFVHGLTGHREKTWTAGSTSSGPWPQELLPSKIADARILTFGYDAGVTDLGGMVSNNRIGNHAKNLLAALATHREDDGTNDRPIIFVVHSLGGLVCEDALLASKNSAEDHLRSVLEFTRGIIFLGTPHSGSGLADLAGSLAKKIGLIKQTNAKILEILRSDSEVLARIQTEFHTMLRARLSQGKKPINITCFYEELPILGIGMCVPMDSAILPSYTSIGIYDNHMGMTKYDSESHPGFVSVIGEIRRWMKDLKQSVTQMPPLRDRLPVYGLVVLNLSAKNDDFIGRVAMLDQIERALSPQDPGCHQRLGMYGLGGVGKSQISLRYAQESRQKHADTHIFWLDAGSREAFVQTYLMIASYVGLISPNDIEECDGLGSGSTRSGQTMIPQIKDWLGKGHWLMIIDNADDAGILVDPPKSSLQPGHESLAALISYIPTATCGRVIFTSRNKQAALRLTRNGKVLHVPRMEAKEAIELFNRKIDGDQDCSWADQATSAAEMVRLLDYLPLAIVQAASYIRESSGSIKSYLNLYCESKESRTKLLSKDFDDPSRKLEQPNAVTLTWAISFNQIRQQRPGAAEALSIMSLFNSKDIPRVLLRKAEQEAFDLDEDLGLLKAYSLVTSDVENKYFSLHDLVQVATRQWMEQNADFRSIADTAVLRLYEYYTDSLEGQWHKYTTALPHARALYQLIKCSETRKHEFIFDLFHTSSHLAVIGQLKDAEKMDEWALVLGQELYPPASLEMISLWSNSASTSIRSGDFREAEAKLRKVMTLQEQVPGINVWDRLKTAKKLAHTVSHQGDQEAAFNILEPALAAIDPLAVRTGNFDFLDAHLELGSILGDQGKYDKAEQKFDWVYESTQDAGGVTNHNSISTLSITAMARLGAAFLDQGKYEQAGKVLEKSLSQARQVTPIAEVPKDGIRENLAKIYQHQRKYDEAECLAREVVQSRTRLYGEKHLETQNAIVTLAEVLSCMEQRFDEARLLCRRAQKRLWATEQEWTYSYWQAFRLSTIRANLGDLNDAEVILSESLSLPENKPSERYRLLCRRNLAQIAQMRGEYDKAKALKTDILNDSEQAAGSHHQDTIIARYSLATCLVWTNEPHLAEQMFQQVLRDWEKIDGQTSAHYYGVLKNLGKTLRLQKLYQEAEVWIRRAYEGYMKLYGPNHPDTIDCCHEQGLIVLMERRFDNAEVLFKEALNKMQATLGPCHLTTIACTRNLAETLFHQRKFDQAISKCQDALQCSNELCGSDHLSTLKILNLYCCLTECLAGQVIRIRDIDALEGDGKQTQLVTATAFYEGALSHIESLFGKSSLQEVQVLSHVAKQMNKAGYLDDAEKTYKRALDIELLRAGDQAIETRRLMHDLGFVLMKLGRLEEADAILQRADKGDIPPIELDHEEVFAISLTRAKLYHERGHTTAAEDGFLDVLEKKSQQFTGDEPDKPRFDSQTSYAYWALGNIYEEQKWLEDAEINFQRAVQNDDTASLNKHSLILRRDLARVICLRGDYTGSETILRSILPKIDELFGKTDMISATATSVLALALSRQRRNKEALQLCDRKYEALRDGLGDEDETTKEIWNSCEAYRELIRRNKVAANATLELEAVTDAGLNLGSAEDVD